jgi:hypothetical protein
VSGGFKDVVFKRFKKKKKVGQKLAIQPNLIFSNSTTTPLTSTEIITKGALTKHINVIEVN